MVSSLVPVLDYTDQFISVVLACDGIAPMAKLNRMRRRRRERPNLNSIRNKITFGTIFFNLFLEHLKDEFGQNKRFSFDFTSKGMTHIY